MIDNIPKHFCQRVAIVIQFEFLLGTKLSSKYFVAILKWFYGIKFKVSTISLPQKYILKFTAITITGLSEPEGHWLSKSFGKSAKGQIISKGLFGVLEFSQKTNVRKFK